MQIPDVSGRGLAGPSSASGGGPRLGLAQPGLPEAPGLGGRGRRRAQEEAGEEEGAGGAGEGSASWESELGPRRRGVSA